MQCAQATQNYACKYKKLRINCSFLVMVQNLFRIDQVLIVVEDFSLFSISTEVKTIFEETH